MEKTLLPVPNTGLALQDIYTIRIPVVDKRALEYKYYEDPKRIRSIKFDTGLLAQDGPYYPFGWTIDFESSNKPELKVEYPAIWAKKTSKCGIVVSGMKLRLLANGREHYSESLKPSVHNTEWVEVDGETYVHTTHYYYSDNLSDTNWTDSINELKIDITVSSEFTELKFLKCNKKKAVHSYYENIYRNESTGLSEYFLSPKFSDVSIKCGKNILPAHVLVLRVNSPVFAQMFEHDMKEVKENCVEIRNTDPNVVREMLRYFYKRKVEYLDVIGRQLFLLADQYMNEDLKSICENYLAANVNMNNVREMYCLGYQNEMHVLTEASKQVLSKNRNVIKNLTDLQEFLSSFPASVRNSLFEVLWNN